MKLAVAGKGGVGKTTLVVLLAREAVTRGYRVIAVDADPDAKVAVVAPARPTLSCAPSSVTSSRSFPL